MRFINRDVPFAVFIRALLRVMCNARDSYYVLVSSDYCRRRRSFSHANHPDGKVYFEFVHLFVNRVTRHIRAFAWFSLYVHQSIFYTRDTLMTIFSQQNNRRHGKLNNKFVTHKIRDYTTDPSRDSYFRPRDRLSKHVCD